MEKIIEKTGQILTLLPDYVSKFIRSIRQRTEPKTRLEYTKDLKNFLEYVSEYSSDNGKGFILKDIPLKYLESLDREFFEDYMGYLERYEKNGTVYTNSRTSVKRKLSALRKFFNFLYINDYIKTNNILKVEIPKLRDKQIVYMNNEETRDFLNGVSEGINNSSVMSKAYHEKLALRDITLISLMLSTGIRVSECVGLDIQDVDLKNMCIRITRKGGKEGIVYFSDDVCDTLTDYMAYRKKQTPKDEAATALFLSSRMTRLGVRSVEKLVKKYARATVPMKKITPHKLRSTYGTALYEKTNDIYVVADVLGHNNINTTGKHYSNMSDKRKREVRNSVDYTDEDE